MKLQRKRKQKQQVRNMSSNAKHIPTYAIFAYQTYYPAGGFNDIYDFAYTLQEALAIYEEALTVGSKPLIDWSQNIISNSRYDHKTGEETIVPEPRQYAHIVNLLTRKIVVNYKEIIDIRYSKKKETPNNNNNNK